ncbi:MAG: DUF1573 domain-containing protein [Bdellovibrionales bacterium]|nr:DUF1573 domain-containing protein [Bdellovibrionales bacterium]
MFRRIATFSISLVLLPLFVSLACAQEEKTPQYAKLHIPQATYDFGSVSQGLTVSHDFVVENKGEGALHIQRIVPSCGCTASSVDKDFIQAGASGKVHVDFDTSGFSGEKVKTVRLYTNDPDNLSAILSLRGTIEPDVLATPKRLYFGELLQGGPEAKRTKIVTTTAREGSKVKLGEVSTRSKFIEISMLESSATKKQLQVTLLPDIKLGEFRDRLVVRVSGAKQQAVNIPVFASIKGPIRVRPSAVSFGVLEGAQPLQKTVKIENLGSTPLLLQDIESHHPSVKATKKVVQEGKVYVVNVTVDPSLVKKELRGSLEIQTNLEDQPSIKLSVYGVLPPHSK